MARDNPPVTPEMFVALVREEIPISRHLDFEVESLADGEATIRMFYGEELRRPGGSISGPVLMSLADTAFFGALASRIGLETRAFTLNLNVNFLRRPKNVDLVARARILRLGSRTAFGEVHIYSDGDPEPVCHATGSYAILPGES